MESFQAVCQVVDIAYRQACKANDLIENLLALAESGQEPHFVEVNISDVVDGIVQENADFLILSGMRIEVDDMGTVAGDPTEIYQIFANLISTLCVTVMGTL